VGDEQPVWGLNMSPHTGHPNFLTNDSPERGFFVCCILVLRRGIMQEREFRKKIRSEAPRNEDGMIDWNKVPAISRIIATGVGGAAIINTNGDVVGVSIPMRPFPKKSVSVVYDSPPKKNTV
jgi:hypothetical protein